MKSMTVRNTIVFTLLIFLVLTIELAVLCAGATYVAIGISAVAAITSFILFTIRRSGEYVVLTAACLGYALAIIVGTIADTILSGAGIIVGLAFGSVIFMLQISLTLAYIGGRL